MNNDLIQKVIDDTEYHVEHSADPEFHRSAAHIENVVKPHLSRIEKLLLSDDRFRFEAAIEELDSKNQLAAQSLRMIVNIIRERGIDVCLRICLGNTDA